MSGGKEIETIDDVVKGIDDDIKILTPTHDTIERIEEFEQKEMGGIIAHVGAYVVSVEGEQWNEGMNVVSDIAVIGRFVYTREFPDGYQIKFTTLDGLYHRGTGQPLPEHRRIEHPLSKKGYYVPRNGGFRTLHKGLILLVSRSGIFSGKGGYGQAKEYRRLYIEEGYRINELEDRLQQVTTQLKYAEAQNLVLSGTKDDITRFAMKLENESIRAKDAVVRLREDYLSVVSWLDSVQTVKGQQDELIRKKLTNMQYDLNILMTHLRKERYFEANLLNKSTVPDMRKEISKDMIVDMRKKGSLPESEEDLKQKELENKMQELDKKIEETRKKMEEKSEQKDKPAIILPPPPSEEKDDERDDDIQDEIDKIDEMAGLEEPQPKKETVPKGTKEKITAMGQELKTSVKKAVAKPPKEEKSAKKGDEQESEKEDDEGGDEEDTDED